MRWVMGERMEEVNGGKGVNKLEVVTTAMV